MEESEKRIFRYNPNKNLSIFISLYVIKTLVLGSLIAFQVDYFLIGIFEGVMVIPISIVLWMHIRLSSSWLSIDSKEVVYQYGWRFKKTISVPVSNIKTCSKKRGVLGKLCGTTDICITTAEYSSKIRVRCLENGEEAYDIIESLK